MKRLILETDGNIKRIIFDGLEFKDLKDRDFLEFFKNWEGGKIEIKKPEIKQKVITDKNHLPKKLEIKNFIKTLPDYKHQVKDVSIHFLGYALNSVSEERKYNRLYRRIKRVHKIIQREEKGKWKIDRNGFGSQATYTFIKF